MQSNVSLTQKQETVLRLVMEGRTLDEIGGILGVSRSSAKQHTDVLRRKLGAQKKRHLIGLGYTYFASKGE